MRSRNHAWHPNRRAFLASAAKISLAMPLLVSCRTSIVTPSVQRRGKVISPNARLNHACVGVGGMGAVDLQNFLQHPKVQITALCDVDSNHLDKAAALVPAARLYSDWRELLDQEGGRIDSVNVSVPDHMHFSIAYTAIEAGKHVYCQKPLCHDVCEVRELTQASVRANVRTQLGTQMASGMHDRTAVQWLRDGRIGKVTRVYLCSNRPGAVETYRLPGPKPTDSCEPPASLAWDLWLGTAPFRPFAKDIYHPTKWRSWQDFGTGWSGDIGCHVFDAVWKGLQLRPPLAVEAHVQSSWVDSPERRKETWPQGEHITWNFPGNEHIAGNHLAVEWFDGDYYLPEHIRKLASPDLKDFPPEAAMVIGTEGALLIPLGLPPQLLPEEKFQHIKPPQFPPRNHYHHFVDSCLGGEPTESHFEQTGPMTEAILLGTVAIRLPAQKLSWDPVGMTSKNKYADSMLRRQYRDGWHVATF